MLLLVCVLVHQYIHVLPPFDSTFQVIFFLGFSFGVFLVISVYDPAVYFVRLGEAGEFYLEAFCGFFMS